MPMIPISTSTDGDILLAAPTYNNQFNRVIGGQLTAAGNVTVSLKSGSNVIWGPVAMKAGYPYTFSISNDSTLDCNVGEALKIGLSGSVNVGGGLECVVEGGPAAVIPVNPTPVNTVPPTITGTATANQTLTYHAGTWTNSPVITLLWQHGDGSAAAGSATGTTYIPLAGDVGFTMIVYEIPNGVTASKIGSLPTAAVTWNPSLLTNLLAAPNVAACRSSGNLWQDAAKTVPAVADGDPVYVMVDTFTGVNFVAYTDNTNRATLHSEGGGKWSLLFDGVASCLIGVVSLTWTALTHACYVRCLNTAVSSYGVAAASRQGVNGWRMCVKLSGVKWGTFSGGDKAASTTLPLNTYMTLGMNGGTFRFSGANDGTYSASSGLEAGVIGSSDLIIGADEGFFGSRQFAGRMAGFAICTAAISAGDQTSLETYLAALAG